MMKLKRMFALLLLAMGLIVANAAEATGAAGPTGKKRPTGYKGLKGDKGATGATGQTGATGRTGTAGPKGGAKGDKGDAGLRGATGVSAPVHEIGEQYQGGIVFWVDADGQHGLIAAKVDQGTATWNNSNDPIGLYTHSIVGTPGLGGINGGFINTTSIIVQQNTFNLINHPDPTVARIAVSSAAQLTADYTECPPNTISSCYDDWYLPSVIELEFLLNQKDVVGNFVGNYYWSSNESEYSDGMDAIALCFNTIGCPNGDTQIDPFGSHLQAYKHQVYSVRAIRPF